MNEAFDPERPGMHPTRAHVSLQSPHDVAPSDRWQVDDSVQQQIDWLASFDPDAHDYLVDNMETWAAEGFDNFDPQNTDRDGLCAPVGRKLERQLGPQRPWMCEAKTHETSAAKKRTKPPRAVRQWRLYFIDISSHGGDPDHMLCGVHFAEKWVSHRRKDKQKVTNRQNQDMKTAATKARAWCKNNARHYRLADEIQ